MGEDKMIPPMKHLHVTANYIGSSISNPTQLMKRLRLSSFHSVPMSARFSTMKFVMRWACHRPIWAQEKAPWPNAQKPKTLSLPMISIMVSMNHLQFRQVLSIWLFHPSIVKCSDGIKAMWSHVKRSCGP